MLHAVGNMKNAGLQQIAAKRVAILLRVPPEVVLQTPILFSLACRYTLRRIVAAKSNQTNRVFSLIPGTRAFRRRVAAKAGALAEMTMTVFLLLQSIELEQKKRILGKVRNCLQRVAFYDAMDVVYGREFLFRLLLGALLIFSYAFPVYAVKQRMGFPLRVATALGYVVLATVVVNVVLRPLTRILNRQRRRGTVLFVVLSPLLCFALWDIVRWGTLRLHSNATFRVITITAFLVPAIMMTLVGPVAAIVGAVVWSIELRKRRNWPDAVVVSELLSLANALEARKNRRLEDFNTKRTLTRQLETAAQAVQEFVPSGLHSGDRQTDEWMRSRMRGIAAGIRSLKLWVLTPKMDTPGGLKTRVAELLMKAVQGRWDDMPVHLQPPVVPKWSWGSLFRFALALAAVAVLIVIGFIGREAATRWGAVAYFISVYIPYAVLLVLSIADPTRAIAIKDIITTIPLISHK